MTRTKQRILSFIETRGFRYKGATHWTKMFRIWIQALPVASSDGVTLQTYLHKLAYLEQEVRRLEKELEHEAEKDRFRETVAGLMAFRGIGLVTALTLASELGDIRRFAHPRQLMAYLGLEPSEHNSGDHTRRGSIKKTGNTHVRKALVSAAWKYAARPRCSKALLERQQGVSAEVVALAWKTQWRLYKRFSKLSQTKSRCVANTDVARELAGFLWEALRIHTGSALPKAA